MIDNLSFAFLGSTALFLLIFIFVRDAKLERRLRNYEKAIDILNRKLFEMEKRIEGNLDKETINEQIAGMMNRELGDFTASLVKGLKDIQENNRQVQHTSNERFERLERKIKEHFSTPTNPLMDESTIIRLFKEGYSIDEISKELRVGLGEVEFVLRLNNLKN